MALQHGGVALGDPADVVALAAQFDKGRPGAVKVAGAQLVHRLEQAELPVGFPPAMLDLADLFEKLPLFPDGLPEGVVVDDTQLKKIESIIQSMTREERRRPEIVDPSRVVRIATGSGRKVQDVEDLLQRFMAMKEMMSAIGAQPGLLAKIPGFKQLGQVGQLKKMLKASGGGRPAFPPGMAGEGMEGLAPGPRPKTADERKKAKKQRKKLKEQRRKSKKKKKKKKK